MLNIVDLAAEEKKPPLFRLAFRPLFLFGSLFSVLALLAWGAFLIDPTTEWQPYGGWFWWHGHEMLFGFTAAIIAGFLLTAVQNWSGIPGISGWPLFGLFALWLLGRLLMLFPTAPMPVIAIIDTAFLPMAALVLARPILVRKLWRNLMFIPLLLLLAWTNGHSHYRLISGNSFGLTDTQTTILLITLIMAIMSGRVIPFFTANATQTTKPQPIMVLEILALGSIALPMLHSLFTESIQPSPIIGGLYLLGCIAHLIRFHRWQWWLTFSNPLLWSLHLAYLFIVLGLSLLSAYHLGAGFPLTTALHGLTVGGMGLLILAMISRVSLGHTGRMLKVGKWISCGFLALAIAAITRLVAPFSGELVTHLHLASIAAWSLGYGTFIGVYWPVLTNPRVDGRPG